MAACTWDQPEPIVVSETQTPVSSCLPDTVRFSVHVQPLFNYYCVGTYCHSGANPPGNVNLDPGTSHNALTGQGYINTSNPKQSMLYSQMMSTTSPMPPYGNLEKCKTDLILKWIEQGALNN